MIHTAIAYGYQLGGPGSWNLAGFSPGMQLRVPWFDETNPTHDLPQRATAEIIGVGATTAGARQDSHARVADLPFLLEDAVEVSPPGWTREASAPPRPATILPPGSDVLLVDRPTVSRFVLVIVDSVIDVEAAAGHAEEHELVGWDRRIDWDSLLDAALVELGLQPLGMPDWFWYRSGTP